MEYLIELYTPKPEWRNCSEVERAAFLTGVATAMQSLFAGGEIELISIGQTQEGIQNNSGHLYYAVWRFASVAAREQLLEGIAASGWYAYFDHVNVVGAAGGMAQHLEQLQKV